MLKESLWKEHHPVTRSIREIPQIVQKDEKRYEEIIQSCISLKQLFARKNMDENHVDCLVLYRIASGTLQIMEELSVRHICPGLYDLSDFYVDLRSGFQVYLLHPERFQLLDHEQDYEWYPEDERVFGDVLLFDEHDQRLADTRLIYKILVASAKGNVKVPPKETMADYSSLFYKTLSPEWKEIFLKGDGVSHDHLMALLSDSIALEKESARMVREKQKEQAKAGLGEAFLENADGSSGLKLNFNLNPDQNPDSRNGFSQRRAEAGVIYSMFVLLRTETRHSGRISRMLYQQQDELELEAELARQKSCQAFVYGNGSVYSKSYEAYPEGFRIQCEQQIRDYSAGEAIIIAYEMVRETRNRVLKDQLDHGTDGSLPADHPVEWRIYLITDGRLKNDQVFQYAVRCLAALKEEGVSLRFFHDPNYHCEACDKLKQLCEDE